MPITQRATIDRKRGPRHRAHPAPPSIASAVGPSLEETGDFSIRDSGLRLRCGEGILAKSELSHLGVHDCRVWWKAVWPLLDRSSEAFIVLCDPPQHVLGYSAFHCFRENAQLFCTRSPWRRIIVVTQAHISNPLNVLDITVNFGLDLVCG